MWGSCIPRLQCLNPLSAVNFCIETCLRWLQPVTAILFKTIRLSMDNKRTGAAAAIIFLSMNDMDLIVEEAALVDLVLQVACGAVGKQEVATFMRTHVQPGRSTEDS